MAQYEHRQFIIFNVNELSLIDFTQVLETSAETVRKSVDGLKTFVKWDTETDPPCIANLSSFEGPYTYDEISTIVNTPEWTQPSSID